MAPTVKKRASTRPGKSSSNERLWNRSTYPDTSDSFKTTKDDKRRIKHATLISRIEKSNTKTKKRRRPSKKLVANLESLVDALPEIATRAEDDSIVNDVRVRHRSLRSKPGAMKKKEKLEKLEMERFSKNMAQMANTTGQEQHHTTTDGSQEASNAGGNASQRWAALRGFIQSTLDRDVTSRTN